MTRDSGSIPPAGRHKRSLLDAYKLWGPVVMSIAAGVLSAYGFIEGYVQKRLTDAIAAHDEDRAGTAHAGLRARLEHAEEELRELRVAVPASANRIEKDYKALYEIYWFRVGEKAIELEPNRKLHARARAEVQRQFEQLVRDGEPLEDAYRRALSTAAGLPGERGL